AQAVLLAEDRRQLVGRRHLELIVAAVLRGSVGPPAQERRRVPETTALQVIVLHLADALDAKRLPGQVLARVPAALRARHALALVRRVRPFPPGMVLERSGAQRRQLGGERAPCGHRERGRDPDVLQRAVLVVQPEQQRADDSRALLVPAEAGDDAVCGARVLDLQHRALAGLVRALRTLGDHTVEPGALETPEPVG